MGLELSPRGFDLGQGWHASCSRYAEEAAQEATVTAGSRMGLLRGLLASDHRQTLDFFIVGLRDVSEPSVDRQELLYNASVLAPLRASVNASPQRDSRAGIAEHGLRPFRVRLLAPVGWTDDGNRRRAVSPSGRVL